MKNTLRLLFICFLFTFSSCTSDDTCRKNKVVNLKIQFYKYTVNTTTNITSLGAWNVDSLSAKGIGNDSILYNKIKLVNIISLPLHKQDRKSSFLITTNSVNDTLTIIHNNSNQYLSLECGCIKTHYIDSVIITTHSVDSVKIINPDVNTSNATNLRIYN